MLTQPQSRRFFGRSLANRSLSRAHITAYTVLMEHFSAHNIEDLLGCWHLRVSIGIWYGAVTVVINLYDTQLR